MSHKEEVNRKKAREVSHSLAATWQRTSRSGGIISQTARSQSSDPVSIPNGDRVKDSATWKPTGKKKP